MLLWAVRRAGFQCLRTDMDEPSMHLEIAPWLMKTIDDGLQNLIYKEAAPAINEINRQVRLQIEAAKNTPTGSSDSSPGASGTGEV